MPGLGLTNLVFHSSLVRGQTSSCLGKVPGSMEEYIMLVKQVEWLLRRSGWP